jgi:N-glycosylase/DNA lyase
MRITQTDRIEAKKVISNFEVEKTFEEIFYDLCFALLAPQTTFKSNMKATSALKELNFYKNYIDEEKLHDVVRSTRFYKQKTIRLLKAKSQYLEILEIVFSNLNSVEKRNLLVKNVCGLGMKAGSHFLRNLGHKDLAIIDTHVLKYLGCNAPKNSKEYTEIESRFVKIAKQKEMTPVELDAIVWKKCSNTPWENFIH